MSRGTIVLGITGSIAAYKAAELTSMLRKKGYSLHVVLTPAAVKFIAPLTFQTLSGNLVHTDMFSPVRDFPVKHINLAQMADLLLVAPATANFIGKMAAGLGDDLLSAVLLAAKSKVVMAPAMNEAMYMNPIVQRNMKFLRDNGYLFIESQEGRLASGDIGRGRLAEPQMIAEYIDRLLDRKDDLAGKKLLVTAGPTREPLDPVRFLTNHSSGKMGYAIAREAELRGAQVILISGPTNLEAPAGVETVFIETAEEMFENVLKYFPDMDIVVKAAAVADFRPKNLSPEKIKKCKRMGLALELEATPDILTNLGKIKEKQVLVGFAAETENLLENAKKKLTRKNLDLLVANDVTLDGAGFRVDTNIAVLLLPDGSIIELPKMTKIKLARVLLDEVVKVLNFREGKGDT